MTASCHRHAQIFNFLDNVIVHVIESGKTKMAQVDAGNYDPGDCRSKAVRELQEASAEIRESYAAGKIPASTLLDLAARHFKLPEVQRELNAFEPFRVVTEAENDEENEDDPAEADEPEGPALEPEVVLVEPGERSHLFVIPMCYL